MKKWRFVFRWLLWNNQANYQLSTRTRRVFLESSVLSLLLQLCTEYACRFKMQLNLAVYFLPKLLIFESSFPLSLALWHRRVTSGHKQYFETRVRELMNILTRWFYFLVFWLISIYSAHHTRIRMASCVLHLWHVVRFVECRVGHLRSKWATPNEQHHTGRARSHWEWFG